MKIVLVGTFGLEPKGTVSMRAIPLGLALAKRGHQVTVVVPPWDNPPDSGKTFKIDDVEIVNVKVPSRIPLLWYLSLTYRLLVAIRSLHPDVVHCFKPKGFSGLVADAIWILKRLGLSHVRLVMDTDDLEGSGGWNDIENYSPLQRWFFARQERRGLRQCNSVTVASLSLLQFARDTRGSENNIYYLPNGASSRQMARFSSDKVAVRTAFGLGMGPLLLLYTRFFEFSLPRVAEIISRVFAESPDARLVIVGKGLFHEEKTFADLLAERQIGHSAVFTGWVQPEQLGSFFNAADLAIYPMDDTLLNRTKCPVKLIDLLVAGVPVVADRVGQTAQYIVDGESGFLVNPEDSDSFVKAVVTLLNDRQLQSSFGNAAASRIRENFMWDALSKRAEEAYQE